MKPPIIFLDIDGVLCTVRSHIAYGGQGLMQHLDPVAVKLVAHIARVAKAQIVLSSTWREFHDQKGMTAILQNSGWDVVPWHQNWKTPVRKDGVRHVEILNWLSDNGGAAETNFIVIDDRPVFLAEHSDKMVRTKDDEGFLFSDFQRACRILGID